LVSELATHILIDDAQLLHQFSSLVFIISTLDLFLKSHSLVYMHLEFTEYLTVSEFLDLNLDLAVISAGEARILTG